MAEEKKPIVEEKKPLLGEKQRKRRFRRAGDVAGTAALAATVVGAAFVFNDVYSRLKHDGNEPDQPEEPPQINLYPDGAQHTLPISLDQEKVSAIVGHNYTMQKFHEFLQATGRADYGNSSLYLDENRNLVVKLAEKGEHPREMAIPFTDAQSILSDLMKAKQVNIIEHGYETLRDSVVTARNDPDIVGYAKAILAQHGYTSPPNATYIKLEDGFAWTVDNQLNLNYSRGRRVTMGNYVDNATFLVDEATANTLIATMEDRDPTDFDSSNDLERYGQNKVDELRAKVESRTMPSEFETYVLINDRERIEGALRYLERNGHWNETYDSNELNEVIDGTRINKLRNLDDASSILIYDTPTDLLTNSSAVAIGKRGDRYTALVGLTQNELEAIRAYTEEELR